MGAKKHDPLSIAIADGAAIGHANTGFMLYRELQSLVANANAEGRQVDFLNYLPIIVAAVTNMSLAVELFLKVHAFQLQDSYPEGHDISLLGKTFPEANLNVLRANYQTFKLAPEFTTGFVIDLSGNPKGVPGVPAAPVGNPQTYDEAITEIGRSYVRWRYIYERFGATPFRERVSFPTLWILIQTIRRSIAETKGPTTIRAT